MLEPKSSLSRLVEAIERGAEREIVIARNGRPAARLVPMHPAPVGIAKGLFEVPGDLDTSNPEIAPLFLGQEAS